MFGEERIKNKIESNKKYIYRKTKSKTRKHRWKGTDFGWWPHSPGEAGPHAHDSHLALDCHGHTHTSTALFPFAQANTYRERLSIKGLWGEGRGGICSRQSQCQQGGGWAGFLFCLQLTWACALLSWGQASEAGMCGRTPGRQDVMNVTFLGTENQSWWWQRRCPVYTV